MSGAPLDDDGPRLDPAWYEPPAGLVPVGMRWKLLAVLTVVVYLVT